MDSLSALQWQHVDDALPNLGEWVIICGSDKKTGEAWNVCAEREDDGGGGWQWDSTDDILNDRGSRREIEYWARINQPQPRRWKGRPAPAQDAA